jgi:hypothetical protein
LKALKVKEIHLKTDRRTQKIKLRFSKYMHDPLAVSFHDTSYTDELYVRMVLQFCELGTGFLVLIGES